MIGQEHSFGPVDKLVYLWYGKVVQELLVAQRRQHGSIFKTQVLLSQRGLVKANDRRIHFQDAQECEIGGFEIARSAPVHDKRSILHTSQP